jgi:hypothetical protein
MEMWRSTGAKDKSTLYSHHLQHLNNANNLLRKRRSKQSSRSQLGFTPPKTVKAPRINPKRRRSAGQGIGSRSKRPSGRDLNSGRFRFRFRTE